MTGETAKGKLLGDATASEKWECEDRVTSHQELSEGAGSLGVAGQVRANMPLGGWEQSTNVVTQTQAAWQSTDM